MFFFGGGGGVYSTITIRLGVGIEALIIRHRLLGHIQLPSSTSRPRKNQTF